MHKKAIVHLMTKSWMKSSVFSDHIDAIEEVSEKYWIKNVIFYKGEPLEYADLITKLEKFWIFFYNYSNKDDLKNQINEFIKNYEVISITTAVELLINTVNEVKRSLNFSLSDNPDLFRNKFLQRELIQNHNPELGIKFIKADVEELSLNIIEEKVGYPFIIKPVDGLQSSWVAKIQNRTDYENYMATYIDFHDRLKARWIDNSELIVEEFIDGRMYSVDYWVDSEGNVTMSKAVWVSLWIDFKFEDYCNVTRTVTDTIEDEFKWKRLKSFVNSTVKACWIKSTFVHHEFKINSKWDFKTIELNGRLGWWRLEILSRSYGLNMYEMICNPDIKPGKLKENNIAVNIYASRRWMLRDFNRKLIDKISERETVYKVELLENFVWKEIGLTKDWFIKIWAIKLAHKDCDKVEKDLKYIKSKYKDLLFIDEFDNTHHVKKRSIIWKIRDYINV